MMEKQQTNILKVKRERRQFCIMEDEKNRGLKTKKLWIYILYVLANAVLTLAVPFVFMEIAYVSEGSDIAGWAAFGLFISHGAAAYFTEKYLRKRLEANKIISWLCLTAPSVIFSAAALMIVGRTKFAVIYAVYSGMFFLLLTAAVFNLRFRRLWGQS